MARTGIERAGLGATWALAAALGIWAPVGSGQVPGGSAFAQGADVTLDNVRLSAGTISYLIPRAVVRGTNLSKAELEGLLAGTGGTSIEQSLARVNAREIAIPEITATLEAGPSRQVTVYRDIVISNMAGGKVGSLVAGGGRFSTTGGPAASDGSFGRFSIDDMDLSLSVALTKEKAGPTPDPLRKVYGAFAVDALEFKDKDGNVTRIARMSGRDFLARTTKLGWAGFMDVVARNPNLDTASPEEKTAFFAAMSDMFDAFAFDNVEMSGLDFAAGPGQRGKVARVRVTGSSPTRIADVSLEGMEVGGNDGTVRIGSIGFSGFSVKPMFENMGALAGLKPEEMSGADIRKLIPMIGTMQMAGVDVDVPADKENATPGERVRFSLGGVEVATSKPVEGVPSDIRFSVRNVAFVVPPTSDNDAAKQLKELGYERLDMSMAASLGWEEGSQQLVLREISLGGIDVGNAVIRGVLGNVSRDVFNPDSAVATVAALGATAKSLEILVENKGLAERILAKMSKEQGRPVEDIRREAGAMAMIGIPAMLGNAPAAKTIGQTVARFVAKPGRLQIKAVAKSPTGLGAADLAAGPDPVAIMEQLDITATAE